MVCLPAFVRTDSRLICLRKVFFCVEGFRHPRQQAEARDGGQRHPLFLASVGRFHIEDASCSVPAACRGVTVPPCKLLSAFLCYRKGRLIKFWTGCCYQAIKHRKEQGCQRIPPAPLLCIRSHNEECHPRARFPWENGSRCIWGDWSDCGRIRINVCSGGRDICLTL